MSITPYSNKIYSTPLKDLKWVSVFTKMYRSKFSGCNNIIKYTNVEFRKEKTHNSSDGVLHFVAKFTKYPKQADISDIKDEKILCRFMIDICLAANTINEMGFYIKDNKPAKFFTDGHMFFVDPSLGGNSMVTLELILSQFLEKNPNSHIDYYNILEHIKQNPNPNPKYVYEMLVFYVEFKNDIVSISNWPDKTLRKYWKSTKISILQKKCMEAIEGIIRRLHLSFDVEYLSIFINYLIACKYLTYSNMRAVAYSLVILVNSWNETQISIREYFRTWQVNGVEQCIIDLVTNFTDEIFVEEFFQNDL